MYTMSTLAALKRKARTKIFGIYLGAEKRIDYNLECSICNKAQSVQVWPTKM